MAQCVGVVSLERALGRWPYNKQTNLANNNNDKNMKFLVMCTQRYFI